MNLAPTTIPYIIKTHEHIMSTPQSLLRQNDQKGMHIIIDMRAKVGNSVTSVCLPVERSPSSSLKSCAWTVVANTTKLKIIARAPILSSCWLGPGNQDMYLSQRVP